MKFKKKNLLKTIMTTLLVIIIFITSFILLNLNTSQLEKRVDAFFSPTNEKRGVITRAWLERYNLKITTIQDLEEDEDNDGLTLLQEYEYLTHPLIADTDGDGKLDGEEVKNGENPRGNGILDINNNKIPDHWEKKNNLSLTKDSSNSDPDKDKLSNYKEYIHLTDPNNPDTDGDGYNDGVEIFNGYDPTAPGEKKPKGKITIEKIGIKAPIIWSKSDNEKDMQEDLKDGVIKLFRTSPPGQSGNSIISGHSSNYVWAKGDYNHIFRDLNDLNKEDEIKISLTQANKRTVEYIFSVKEKFTTNPDDPRIFKETQKPTLTLTTCWPIGTSMERLIIKAKLK